MRIVYPKHDHPSVYIADRAQTCVGSHGSYAWIGTHSDLSQYQGVVFLDKSFIAKKVLHDLFVEDDVHEVRIFPEQVLRLGKKLSLRWFWYKDIFCVEARGKGTIHLRFDARELYDSSTEGREHHISIVDDFSQSTSQTAHVAAIQCKTVSAQLTSTAPITVAQQHQNWQRVDTRYDARRGFSDEWWVYSGATIPVDGMARFCIQITKRDTSGLLLDDVIWKVPDAPKVLTKSLLFAQLSQALVPLPESEFGLIAGQPWFFQVWGRDEAIAIGGLLTDSHYTIAANILKRHVSTIDKNGRIPNRYPHANLASADAFGWSCVRLYQLLKKYPTAYSLDEWRWIYHRVEKATKTLLEKSEDGLIWTDTKETWMDTQGDVGDTREGACIEIQALGLAQLRLCKALAMYLNKDHSWHNQQYLALCSVVKQTFFDTQTKIIADRVRPDKTVDTSVRVNALLCAYIIPELFSENVWKQIFSAMLPQLELTWGGISSLSKSHPWFCATHDATNNRSYHRGDSWYVMNNLVGIVCARLGKPFISVAKNILSSSEKDLFEQGFMGRCSEISSASEQQAFGCWSQTWSAGTLLELLTETSYHN